jgi:hypothetical protein
LNFQSHRFFFGSLGLIVALGFIIQSFGTLNPDVSWINYGVTRLLSGAKLYDDIVEVNPPTIYYLSMPPIWLATVTGYDSSPLYVLWVMLVAALSASIGYFTFNDKRPQTLALCLAYACLVTVLIGEAFGQREHLMIMLLSPYVFLKIAKLEKPGSRPVLAVLIGVLAAVAIALKPHYLLVIIALEAMEMYRRKRFAFSAETIAGLLTALVLLAGLLVFHPEFFKAIIPLAAKAYLPFYRESTTTILGMFGLTVSLLTIQVFAEKRGGFQGPGSALLTASAASALAMLLQFRGFPYQILPALFFLIMSSAYWIFAPKPTEATWIAFPGIIVLTFLMRLNSPLAYQAAYPPAELTPKGTSIAIFSTNIGDGFPFAPAKGLVWTSRFPSLWFMPFLFESDRAVRMNLPIDQSDVNLAVEFRKQVLDDLIASKPDMIMMRTVKDPMIKTPVDYLATLSKDPRFGAFFANYSQDIEVAGFIYYRRKSKS